MSRPIYIQNKSDVPQEKGWIDKKSFNKMGAIVKHNGHEYTNEVKQCVKYAGWERFIRVLIGLLSVLLSLGGSLASKNIRQLFYKEDKYSRTFAVLKKDDSLPPLPPKPESENPPTENNKITSEPTPEVMPVPHPSTPSQMIPDPHEPSLSSSTSSFELEPAPALNPIVRDSDQIAKEKESILQFYSEVEQMSFWDSYLNTFRKAINDEKWNQIPAMLFLCDELQGIRDSLEQLNNEVQKSIDELVEHKLPKISESNKDADIKSTYRSLLELKNSISNLITETNQSLQELNNKVEQKLIPPAQPQPPAIVRGIGNAGSTCYINSALQPLLAARNFTQLIPDHVSLEPIETFSERQAILDAFNFFIANWEAQMPAAAQGQCIGQLRRQIFEAGLQEGGFVHRHEERSFHDAGQFFELILHIINGGFESLLSKTPVMDDGRELNDRTKTEITPQGVFYLQAPSGTVQEMVDGNREALAKQFEPGNEWRVEHPDTYEEIYIANYVERIKITSNPPSLLVVRVNNRVVDPTVDRNVNFEALFDNPSPENNYEYELVGFSQHHTVEIKGIKKGVHWTSVVWNGEQWQHCDDSKVTPVDPSNRAFKHPANYMVYKKREA